MIELLSRLFGRHGSTQTSKAIAKERLHLVLVHDRAGIPPELLNVIKNEIIYAISRHVQVDPDGIQVNLSQSAGQTKLVADIPLVGHRSNRSTARTAITRPDGNREG